MKKLDFCELMSRFFRSFKDVIHNDNESAFNDSPHRSTHDELLLSGESKLRRSFDATIGFTAHTKKGICIGAKAEAETIAPAD